MFTQAPHPTYEGPPAISQKRFQNCACGCTRLQCSSGGQPSGSQPIISSPHRTRHYGSSCRLCKRQRQQQPPIRHRLWPVPPPYVFSSILAPLHVTLPPLRFILCFKWACPPATSFNHFNTRHTSSWWQNTKWPIRAKLSQEGCKRSPCLCLRDAFFGRYVVHTLGYMS